MIIEPKYSGRIVYRMKFEGDIWVGPIYAAGREVGIEPKDISCVLNSDGTKATAIFQGEFCPGKLARAIQTHLPGRLRLGEYIDASETRSNK